MHSSALRRDWGLVWLIGLAGCSSGSLVPVQGTVKLDSRPLPGATILFIAQDTGGRDARGFTDGVGVFQLTTFKSNDGAMPGKYKVIVQPPAETVEGAAATTPEAAQKAATSGETKPQRPAVTIPSRYSQPDQTTLVQEIPAKGEILFDLKSK